MLSVDTKNIKILHTLHNLSPGGMPDKKDMIPESHFFLLHYKKKYISSQKFAIIVDLERLET